MNGFDWDGANVGHIARHGVTPDECEQVFNNGPTEDENEAVEIRGEVRRIAYGITDDARLLTVPYTMRGDLVRPITAWPMSRNERKSHAKLHLEKFFENFPKDS